jgi:hypothetical protein
MALDIAAMVFCYITLGLVFVFIYSDYRSLNHYEAVSVFVFWPLFLVKYLILGAFWLLHSACEVIYATVVLLFGLED